MFLTQWSSFKMQNNTVDFHFVNATRREGVKQFNEAAAEVDIDCSGPVPEFVVGDPEAGRVRAVQLREHQETHLRNPEQAGVPPPIEPQRKNK